jgi:hypothetical protein
MIRIDPLYITSKFPSRKVTLIGPAHQVINGSQRIPGYCAVGVIFPESPVTRMNFGGLEVDLAFPSDTKVINPSPEDFLFDADDGGAQELLSRLMPAEDEFESVFIQDSERRALMNLSVSYDQEEDTQSYSISYGNLYPHVVCAYGQLLQLKDIPERVDTIAARKAIGKIEEEMKGRPLEDIAGLEEKLTIAKELFIKDFPSKFIDDN